jgi:pectinesterase
MKTTAACCAIAALAAGLAGAPTPAWCAAAGHPADVAADGSGQFKSIQEAINAAPQSSGPSSPWTIRVGPGTYRERLYVQREKRFVRLVGEDPLRTTVAFDLYAAMTGPDGKAIGTFHTPTVWIDADDFRMENLTVANTAGKRGQALALRVDGDRVAFLNCRFLGWQDTVLVNRGRQYFEGCAIAGAVDFIFGAATAYFDRCEINCLGDGYVTAASTPAEERYGMVFTDCRIAGASPEVRTYLGRPWRPYAEVTFVRTEMTSVVRPVGWHNWSKPEREATARYTEAGSSGPGANPSARATWARTLAQAPADDFTVDRVLGGADHWNPAGSARPESSQSPQEKPEHADNRD